MGRANPYNYNLPVEPEMFFGRHADVMRLVNDLTAAPGDSIALIGGRRMGKTSMLEALRRGLQTHAEQTTGQLLPIFIDLSGEGIDSVIAFFQTVYEQAQTALTTSLDLPNADVSRLEHPPAPAFRRALETWGRIALAQRGCSLRIVLLLDECEEIVEQSWATELHAALRALLVSHSTRSLLKVVMAGSHRFLTQVRQRGSPLWNILVYHMLRTLDDSATRELIVLPTNDVLKDEIVQAIMHQSGGQPFLTQYLMHQLWDIGLLSTTPDLVAQLAAAFSHERNDFVDWAGSLGEAGLHIYDLLARATEPLTERDIQAALKPAPTNLALALDALCYHGVAVRIAKSEGYQVAGEMFRSWFIATNLAASDSSPGLPLPENKKESLAILQIKRRRLEILEQQQAIHGIETPPHIVLEIEDLRRDITSLDRQISSL
jgi:hypothetical protein